MTTIDSAYIAQIVRKVIAKIQTTQTQTGNTATSIPDRIVTVETINQLPGTPSSLFVSAKAIVTPAAQDEAKSRGITINRSVELPPEQVPNQTSVQPPTQTEIIDRENPDRAAVVATQLARRAITGLKSAVILSDTPAKEVFEQCRDGKRAAMIGAIAEVDRFANEMNPDVWVLDMKRMNLIAAVNAVVRITNTNAQK